MNDAEAPVASRWRSRLLVARRDLVEFVRDRRALFITLLMPMAMYPVLALSSTLGVRTALAELEAKPPSRLTLVLSGKDAGGLSRLITALDKDEGHRQPGWPATLSIVLATAAESRKLLDDGQGDAWIEIGPGVLAGLRSTDTVPLEVKLSLERPTGRQVRVHVAAVLQAVADRIRAERVARAGLPESTLKPVQVTFMKGRDPEQMADQGVQLSVLGAVLVLLALLMATGAFYPAIDAIAGEKERGTIETLLIAPCPPLDLVLGKFIAVFVVTLATLAANAVSIALTASVLLRLLPAGSVPGLPTAGAAILCIGVTIVAYVGLAAVSAALCLAVTAASKSVKEAQNTLTPVMLLVSALAGSALVPGAADSPWLAAMPFAGQVAVSRMAFAAATRPDATGGGHVGTVALPLGLSLAASAAIAWLLLRFTATLLTDEEILFRGPDVAVRGLRRPARRRLPTPRQGLATVAVGLAAIWYSQGLGGVQVPQMLIAHQALTIVLPLLVASSWQRVDGRATYALRWPGRGGPWRTALACLGAACVGGSLFVLGSAAFLAIRGTDLPPAVKALAERLAAVVTGQPWWVSLSLLALMPAVCEELLFRGWLLSSLAGRRPGRGRETAVIAIQAAIFAVFHLFPERMPQAFLLGAVMGWMVLRTGSLLPAVCGHLVHNGLPCLLLALAARNGGGTLDPAAATGVPVWGMALAALAAVVGAGCIAAVGRPRPDDI
jgi:sodium transport system permease protein